MKLNVLKGVNIDYRMVIVIILALIALYLFIKKRGLQFMSIEQRIRLAAQQKGMPHNMRALLVAQAKHETANFTSALFKANNNLYGYKKSGSKYQVNAADRISPEGNAYAAYAKLEDSVYEVCDWIIRRQKEGKFPEDLRFVNADEYASLLKSSGYFTDSVNNYLRGLNKYLA